MYAVLAPKTPGAVGGHLVAPLLPHVRLQVLGVDRAPDAVDVLRADAALDRLDGRGAGAALVPRVDGAGHVAQVLLVPGVLVVDVAVRVAAGEAELPGPLGPGLDACVAVEQQGRADGPLVEPVEPADEPPLGLEALPVT